MADPSTLTITSDQGDVLSVSAVDDHNNPVPVAALALAWASSDASIVTIVDNADGTATISATGPDGAAVITVVDSVSGLTGECDVTVVSGKAVALVVTPGVPTP